MKTRNPNRVREKGRDRVKQDQKERRAAKMASARNIEPMEEDDDDDEDDVEVAEKKRSVAVSAAAAAKKGVLAKTKERIQGRKQPSAGILDRLQRLKEFQQQREELARAAKLSAKPAFKVGVYKLQKEKGMRAKIFLFLSACIIIRAYLFCSAKAGPGEAREEL